MGLMTDPSHPGEILKHEFLEPLGVSAIGLARAIGVPRTRIERLVKEQTAVTPDTALRLSKALGTSAEFWINLQANYDMAAARKTVDVSDIRPLVA
ncbi:HigA family addiction module antitoxin [Pseudooceanicola sp. MF1-13]|uniref:HigA family addiction module antitoxin n=1 Tax=Pseudooceanicola sp. MF1-13 TaxID=3379095 RepID=UPI0038915499